MAKKKKKVQRDYYRILRETFEKVYDGQVYKDRRAKMERHLKEYTGEWWAEDLGEHDSKIFANFIFQVISGTAPLLTDNKPIWSVRARQYYMQSVANMYNKAGEYLWDKLDMDMTTFMGVVQSLLWNVGLFKLRYDPDNDECAVDTDDPRTFAISPGYEDIWDCAWCGVKAKKPMSWIYANYPDKAEEVEPSENVDAWKALEADYTTDWEGYWTYVYEIWIRDPSIEKYMIDEHGKETQEGGTEAVRPQYPNGRIVTMTTEVTLDDKASPYSHGKPPWVPIYDYRIPGEFWGFGEPVQIEDMNREYNRALQDIAGHTHITGDPNYTVDSASGLDPEKVKKELPEGGNVWAVNPGFEDPIKQVRLGSLGPDHKLLIELIPQVIEEISGQTDISKGFAAKKERQSASEVSILIESSYTRTRQRIRNLEWSLKRVFYLLVELMQQFYDQPRSISYKDRGSEELQYGNVGNTRAMAEASVQAMQPPTAVPGQEKEEDERFRRQVDEDYEELVQSFGGTDMHDPVYMPFDIEIQTNSTLPIDRQSMANLMIRLAGLRIHPEAPVDSVAIQEMLGIPNSEEITNRQKERMKAIIAAKQGGGGKPNVRRRAANPGQPVAS